MTAQDLLSLGVIERVFSEEKGFENLYGQLKTALCQTLSALQKKDISSLLNDRYRKFRKIGG